jgi:hypothetical protein
VSGQVENRAEPNAPLINKKQEVILVCIFHPHSWPLLPSENDREETGTTLNLFPRDKETSVAFHLQLQVCLNDASSGFAENHMKPTMIETVFYVAASYDIFMTPAVFGVSKADCEHSEVIETKRLNLEARGGIEPPIMVLQTIALPLGDRATGLKRSGAAEAGETVLRRPVPYSALHLQTC